MWLGDCRGFWVPEGDVRRRPGLGGGKRRSGYHHMIDLEKAATSQDDFGEKWSWSWPEGSHGSWIRPAGSGCLIFLLRLSGFRKVASMGVEMEKRLTVDLLEAIMFVDDWMASS